MPEKFDLEDRLLEFAVRISRVTESMKRTRAGLHVADQLLRSGTLRAGILSEADGLIRIFAASIRTAENNMKATK